MADSYYRTIKGKQYDRELLEIVEKATKRTKSPLNKNVAKNLFEAIKDGNDYTETEKRTVKYIRENFSFSEEADEYLRTEIRKWAAKISVAVKKPSAKKAASKKSKSSNTRSKTRNQIFEEEDSTSYFHSYDESEEDEIAPTPEYDELVELNNYEKKQSKSYRKLILIGLIVIAVVAIAYFARNCSCAPSKNKASKQTSINSSNSNTTPKIDLNRTEVEAGKVTSRFKTRGEAIRYINDLKIRFIKQSLTLSSDAPDQIATLASALKEYPEINVRIKGHTCFIGELDENKILSDERAKFIKDELEKNGVSSSQLDYRGFGETTNIDTNYTEAGRIQNRRVDFSVLGVDVSKEKKP
ncbi:hypothetical protein LPTSP3_g02060 [Leptospira kobayashii]|uniref:OmpA-like domain-containing protein n=1 Tax=Leptospira kobayashii TaxID=1917830 RepID=A0ABN6K934_9LEPT|nr:OmpA family protein [Leptospira kobayashii]BDA77276.1 hypothetical protein LPTSP3_g02060 [Leptospira kobayashii]